MKAAILVFFTLLLIQISTQHSVVPRITNGRNAKPKQFAFMASVQYSYLKILPYILLCCGVAIDRYWILSTAVCVKATKGIGNARVYMNMHFNIQEDKNIQSIKIEYRIVHENFDSSRRPKWNNIGLLKLKKEISTPVLVKLPQSGESATGEVIMIGWGLATENFSDAIPEVLQYALVKIIENQECQNFYSDDRPHIRVDGSMVCTLSRILPITACNGDSGGPLIKYVDDEPVLQGIISWHRIPCGGVGTPTISMRASDYTAWIEQKMGETVNHRMKEPKTEVMIETNSDDLLAPLIQRTEA